MYIIKLLFLKTVIFITSIFNRGTSLPGYLNIKLKLNIIKNIDFSDKKIIYVIGTNGKTTTTNLINTLLLKNQKKVITNLEGANLISGLLTLLIKNLKFNKTIDCEYILLEVDEKTLKQINQYLKPNHVIITNFFRDQLDRYLEIELIIAEIKNELIKTNAKIYFSANDPLIYYHFFDLENKVLFDVVLNNSNNSINKILDIKYCPNCLKQLEYDYYHYAHIGKFSCSFCKIEPEAKYHIYLKENEMIFNENTYCFKQLPIYFYFNLGNCLSLMNELGLKIIDLEEIIKNFKFPKGRNKKLIIKNNECYLNLVKNVVGFNETITYINKHYHAFDLFICLNDKYVDGCDISWIYDVDLEIIVPKIKNLYLTGTRCYDMAIRLEAAGYKGQIYVNKDIDKTLKKLLENPDIKVIISNYSEIKNISLKLEKEQDVTIS